MIKLNAVFAFWFAYVLTRPLGASIADGIGKSTKLSGLGFGDGRFAIISTIVIAILVAYVAVTSHDIQPEIAEGQRG